MAPAEAPNILFLVSSGAYSLKISMFNSYKMSSLNCANLCFCWSFLAYSNSVKSSSYNVYNLKKMDLTQNWIYNNVLAHFSKIYIYKNSNDSWPKRKNSKSSQENHLNFSKFKPTFLAKNCKIVFWSHFTNNSELFRLIHTNPSFKINCPIPKIANTF